jgi:SPP1 gp7 family putative phage head morphogenesis protein
MNLDPLLTDTTNLAMSIYAHQVPVWLKDIDSLEEWDPDFVLSEMHSDFQALTQKVIFLSWLIGIDDARKLIKEKSKSKSKEFRDSIITENVWETVGFDNALRKLAAKRIVDPATYKAMDAGAKNIAWSIQRIENQSALLAAKIHLKNCIDLGLSLRDFKNQMSGVYEAYGITPLSPHHIDTVFRTNLLSVYNTAQYETYMADENVVYLQYSAVVDDRITNICLPFANAIYRKDDPIWNIIRPLNHYKCRCGITPITSWYAQSNNITESEKPSQKDLGGIHKDFNNMPPNVIGFQKKLEQVLENKVKVNLAIIEDIEKSLIISSIKMSNKNKKVTPPEITNDGK